MILTFKFACHTVKKRSYISQVHTIQYKVWQLLDNVITYTTVCLLYARFGTMRLGTTRGR